jgi:raffinose/stachyose/melibiose transport system permease protein
VVNIIPIILTILASFKSNQDFFYNTYSLPKVWHLDNYSSAWTDANMGRFFLNSVVVTLGGVVINLVCSTPLAYALARFRFRLNGPLFIFIVGGLIAPGQLIGISLLQWVKTLHLFNTYFSLIFPYAAFGMPVAVLILSGFFRQLPRELEEAALIDGAGEFTAFLRIMVPLVRPALATVIIFNGIGIWNDFFLPLVLAYTPDIQTLPLGIILLFGAFSSEWGTIFAAVIIASVPVIIAYFFLTRQFIAGLSAGAVKG